ncbi:MAG: ATP-binding cassette domain-containing protein [Synergistaceae bacterium]|jgi:ABC-type bacteriocin/lantibiotic exporter with double-glycine peptidase domain|nr:ATP-binding cassette domain-containing protein [Synergistaceae bacterium]
MGTKYKNVVELLSENKHVIFYVFALNILLLIPSALSPLFKQVFTDYILTDGVTEWLAPLLLLMTGTALLSAFVTWMQKSCLLRLSNKIEISGVSGYMWTLLGSPFGFFHKKNSYQLLSRTDASKKISALLTRDLLGLLFNVCSVVFYLVMMFRLDRLMSAVVVGLAVLNFIMSKLRQLLRHKLARGGSPAAKLSDLIFQDERIGSIGLENIETFKSTASETHFIQRVVSSKTEIINAKRDKDFEEAYGPFNTLPEVIFLNLLLMISAVRIMNRGFSVGYYLAFQAYASAFFFPLSAVLAVNKLFGNFDRHLKDLREALDSGEKISPRNSVPAESTGKLDGYIELKNVCFGYESGVPVLQNIDLSIKPGQRIAILGKTGAGKTTLLKLLQGLYEPDSGEISIDGVNPSRMNKRLFAGSIGCANQEITLFAASVRDNITMWDETVSDAEVYNAAHDACIHEYITSLNGAYDFPLSENGDNLGDGQKQRIEIARALLYNPSIVLLDEVSRSIDPINRDTIDKNLIRRGCTCVFATHVLSQAKDYDELIVLDKGRIAQRGTHEELLKSSAFYASAFQKEGPAMAI